MAKGMGDIMKQAQKLQKRMAEMQEQLAEKTVETQVGGGMVKAVANGAQEVLREAGVALLGGHSVQNREPLIGFAVTGRVRPDEILTKQGGQPGDRLILTKPLGTGILATALRSGKLDPEHVGAMTSCMKRLNRDALAVAKGFSIHAATDVTGFGLMGHLHEMAVLSGVRAVAAGMSHTCALMTSGGVRCWGGSHVGQFGDGTAAYRLTPALVEVICP